MKWLQIIMMTKMIMMHGNHKGAEVIETGEALTMLDRLVNLKYISNKERNSLVTMKDK